jgi:energy-coupling factor transport system ATP-binding protein
VIDFDDVSIAYQGADGPTLSHVNLHIDEGDFALVCGRTGSGKSTLLGAVNGHVPHFTGGRLSGRVRVASFDTREHPPRDLAAVVGVVRQNPLAGFVTDTVEEEVAFGMEQLGVAPAVMRTRVEETLDLLSIAELRSRALRSLSGGQQQRVAIASVLAAGARVLVLDEPTSALDPTSAEEVLAAMLRLVHDLGVTLLLAEHRLERVVEYADRMVVVDGGQVSSGTPAEMLATSPLAPPVVELGKLAGWSPLPQSIRDARRRAGDLRQRLAGLDPLAFPREAAPAQREVAANPALGLQARDIEVAYGRVRAVRRADLDLPAGEVTALLGRNGSGKSSLLWALTGVGAREGGTWCVGKVQLDREPSQARKLVRMVPQTASDLLYLNTVAAECAAADSENGREPGCCRAILDLLAPGIPADRHPRDLSEGQQLALVLAVQLAAKAPALLLDEPTRGLDYPAKAALGKALRELAAQGLAICVATHDVEFAATAADRAVVMAVGEIIAAGPVSAVLATSAVFAPQVAKTLSPAPWLSVGQVASALGSGK